MATVTTTARTADVLREDFSAAIYAAMQRATDYLAYRRTVRELAKLGHRELADLGLHRSEIRRVAKEAVYGPLA